jgi:uncharacterized protein YwgA
MFEREALLLVLLARLGRVWGKTRMQKLMFLSQADAVNVGNAPFRYYLYKHGPFSLDLALTLGALRDRRYVHESLHRSSVGNPVYLYVLTDEGRRALEDPRASQLGQGWQAAIESVVRRYGGLDLPFLVEQAYARARVTPALLSNPDDASKGTGSPQ